MKCALIYDEKAVLITYVIHLYEALETTYAGNADFIPVDWRILLAT